MRFSFYLAALALTTCQSFNSVIQEPKVHLNSVDIAGISISGVNLVGHVDVENPNGFSIPLPKIDWELFVNSSPFIQGVVKNDKTIRSRGKATLDLPFSVTYDGLYRSFKSLIETKEAAYNIAMGVSFPLPIIENKIYHLDFSGVLPLPQLPKLSSPSVRVSKMDYSALVLACSVNVENPNGFPIPFPEINFDYSVNGISALKSSDKRTGEIAAGAASPANFNINIAYADIFRLVSSARNANEVKSNLSLDALLPIPALSEIRNVLDIPGTIPILQKPEVSFQGIARRSLGTTMVFDLNWEVDNKNDFTYDIDKFNYNFNVNNSHWAQGVINNPPKIRANGKTIIPLTVSISAAPIVRELVDVLNRGAAVNYDCSGNISFLSSLPGLDIPDYNLDLRGSTRIR